MEAIDATKATTAAIDIDSGEKRTSSASASLSNHNIDLNRPMSSLSGNLVDPPSPPVMSSSSSSSSSSLSHTPDDAADEPTNTTTTLIPASSSSSSPETTTYPATTSALSSAMALLPAKKRIPLPDPAVVVVESLSSEPSTEDPILEATQQQHLDSGFDELTPLATTTTEPPTKEAESGDMEVISTLTRNRSSSATSASSTASSTGTSKGSTCSLPVTLKEAKVPVTKESLMNPVILVSTNNNSNKVKPPRLTEVEKLAVTERKRKKEATTSLSVTAETSSSGSKRVGRKDDSVIPEDDDEDAEGAAERASFFQRGKDFYCWSCHRPSVNISCHSCQRSFHHRCLEKEAAEISASLDKSKRSIALEMQRNRRPSVEDEDGSNNNNHEDEEDFVCPECRLIQEGRKRIKAPTCLLSQVSNQEFITLLKHALKTIKETSEPSFFHPVDEIQFPVYRKFILHPMDFATMDGRIKRGEYESPDSFLSDVKWILHNTYIYNQHDHPLTVNARYFVRVAKNEASELEVCPDCFSNFYVYPKTWFSEVCKHPHPLVWAKLKGHPFWPGKVVQVNRIKKEVDVRFFGAHDKAWIPYSTEGGGSLSLYSLSETYEWAKPKTHKGKLQAALNELNHHVNKINKKFPRSVFQYAPSKTPFNPYLPYLDSNEDEEREKERIELANYEQEQEEVRQMELQRQQQGRSKGTSTAGTVATTTSKASSRHRHHSKCPKYCLYGLFGMFLFGRPAISLPLFTFHYVLSLRVSPCCLF